MPKIIKGKKVYPLTAAQRLHFFTVQYCPKKQVLNIGTSLTIEQDLDFDVLKEAVYQAYERCDTMRLRFITDRSGTVFQYVADHEDRDIQYYDFTGWKEEDGVQKLKEWTELPFEREDSPMNRVVMVKMPDGYQGIYLLVDHMTMDAQALIIFLKDVIELYCHMKYEEIEYPKPMASYLEQLEKDLAYEAGSSAKCRDDRFFQQMIGESEPIYCDLSGADKLKNERMKTKNPYLRAVTNISDHVEANIAVYHLEEEPSRRLMAFCENYQVSMVCLLMMGVRTYLQKVNGLDDVSINTTVARRATLLEKKSGGTRIHCFPFRTIVFKEESFLDGLFKIQQGQNRIFRHANYDPVSYFDFRRMKYETGPGQTYEPMSLTYQPLTLKDKGLDQLGDIRYKSAWYSNGVAAHSLYLTVLHRAEDNGLDFNFEYQTGAYTPEKLEYVYYYLCKILFEAIKDPEKSLGELMDSV